MTLAKATSAQSPARRKLVLELAVERCISRLLWAIGAKERFRQRQIQDLWHPPDLAVDASYLPDHAHVEAH